MQSWLKKHSWWIGLALTILIALFPESFIKTGKFVKVALFNYWLQTSLAIIIILLFSVCSQLRKLKKAS